MSDDAPIHDRVPTPAEVDMFRREAGLGVCTDPRGEFGRDYRILALIKALEDAQASARTAWDVHAEHVDTMNVLIARHAGDATFERIRADKAEEQLATLRARIEALAGLWDEGGRTRQVRLPWSELASNLRAALRSDRCTL